MKTMLSRFASIAFAALLAGVLGCGDTGCGGPQPSASSSNNNAVSAGCGGGTHFNAQTRQCERDAAP